MGIIIDIKNAVRDALYTQDNSLNFNFNKMQVTDFPYIFFYILPFKLDKAIDTDFWRKLTLSCVVEYQHDENNNQITLWGYADRIAQALKLFPFLDTKISAKNMEFRTIDDYLQCTFDLEVYVKAVDDTELMRELELGLI